MKLEVTLSLRNFDVNGNVSDTDLMRRADGFLLNLVGSFRQAAANGNFTFGPMKLQDADLNRVHSIVTEIDSRRLFYNCSDLSKGVWANPSCECVVQEITTVLSQFSTNSERLDPENLSSWKDRDVFYTQMAEMRLQVWLLVAMLKKKLSSIINPRNLPAELWLAVSVDDV